MGVLKLFSDSSPSNYSNPNPNPNDFSIIQTEKINDKFIVEVKYHGCTTFGGRKLLLLKSEYYNGNPLDPHLLGEDHIVLARFEPNGQGWCLARLCANSL